MKDVSIVLGFEDEDVAYEWHAAFVVVIGSLIPAPGDLTLSGSAGGEPSTPMDEHRSLSSPDAMPVSSMLALHAQYYQLILVWLALSSLVLLSAAKI